MKSLTLQQLLEITPLEEAVRKRAIEKLPLMNTDERFKLEEICWKSILDTCRVRIQIKFEKEMEKTAKEGRTDLIDMKQIENQVIHELLTKIEGVQTEDQIEEVKKMLKQSQSGGSSSSV